MRYPFFAGLFLILGLASCIDTPNFDNTPSIQYNSIDKFLVNDIFSLPNIVEADSVVITINFEDGDGDLGTAVSQRDTLLPWGNYRLKTFVKNEKGSFEERIFEEDKQKWFPVLKKDGKPGPIKGKLDLSIPFAHARFTKPTVVKFQVQIRDRAMRESNVVETDTVSVYLF